MTRRAITLITTAAVWLMLGGCGGGGGGGSSGGGGPVRPEPTPVPAVIGIVEESAFDPSGDHARQVAAIASSVAGGSASVRSVDIVLPSLQTFEDLVNQFDQLFAGFPLPPGATPQSASSALSAYDITNGSYGVNTHPLVLQTLGAPVWTNDRWLADMGTIYGSYREEVPAWWRAFAQTDVPVHQRTIRVWSAGNERQPFDGIAQFGDAAMSMHHVKLYGFPDFHGHELIVTALDREGRRIADYANFCGPLPPGWNSANHGRHYCLAAPGHALSGPDEGTSFAAPRVAGVLAQMHVAARETMRGSHLVKRLMDTADNTGEFSNAYVYGAGAVDPQAALSPQGQLAYAGTSGRSYGASTTSVTLPSAYGDAASALAGTELMAWDEDWFPFWRPAEDVVHARARTASPIPYLAFEDGVDAPCGLSASLTDGAHCIAAESTPWRTMAGLDGAGVGYALNEFASVDAYVRSDGRLDGRGRDGLSLAGGSSLLGLTTRKAWSAVGGVDTLRFDARITLAIDAPWGAGRGSDAMLEVGAALLSAMDAGLTVAHRGATTGLRVSQPFRAEAGTATLTYPASRTLDGVPVFERRSFSLSPSRREVTASLRHERDDVVGGRLAVAAWRTENPGHTRAPADHGVGVAWRVQF